MIELRPSPLIHVVAGLAGLGESRRLMVHGLGLLKLRKVAAGTRGVQPNVNSRRRVRVAGIAS